MATIAQPERGNNRALRIVRWGRVLHRGRGGGHMCYAYLKNAVKNLKKAVQVFLTLKSSFLNIFPKFKKVNAPR